VQTTSLRCCFPTAGRFFHYSHIAQSVMPEGVSIVMPVKTGIQIYEAVDNLKKSKEKPRSR
jgi:hypothetical protein